MILALEIAAQAQRRIDGAEDGFEDAPDWGPDADCDCEACLNWLFTGGDLWRGNTFEFDGQTYVKGRKGMRYARKGEDRPFDKL